MTRSKPLFAISLALLASGCAPGLALRSPDVQLPTAYERQGATVVGPIDRWWIGFKDPQLTNLVEQALSRSTDARAAVARLLEARAIRQGALSRFRLQGDLQASAGAQGSRILSGPSGATGNGSGPVGGDGQVGGTGQGGVIIGPGGVQGAGGEDTTQAALNFNISYELDLFGRRGAARRGADADLIAARFAAEASRAAIAADVADALFAARALAVQIEDNRMSQTLQRRLQGVLAERVRSGIAADAELARADAELAGLEAQARGLVAELDANRRSLLVLTGQPSAPLAALPIAARLELPPAVPTSVPGALLERRPDVREAEARLRSAIARAEGQRLELFPRVTLNPGVGLIGTTAPVNAVLATWTLGGGLAVPILDRARLLSELKAESARAEQAAIAYERAVQIAFSESDGALLRLAADRGRVADFERALARAATARGAAETLYSRGLTDLTALLDAQRSERQAREQLSAARADALRRSVTAFRALGGGWDMTSMRAAS